MTSLASKEVVQLRSDTEQQIFLALRFWPAIEIGHERWQGGIGKARKFVEHDAVLGGQAMTPGVEERLFIGKRLTDLHSQFAERGLVFLAVGRGQPESPGLHVAQTAVEQVRTCLVSMLGHGGQVIVSWRPIEGVSTTRCA